MFAPIIAPIAMPFLMRPQMTDTSGTPNDGASQQAWSQDQGHSFGYMSPRVRYPDPSPYYHPLAGPYHQGRDVQPHGSQPSQEHANYHQYAVASYSVPFNRNNDPQQSHPQHVGPGPYVPFNRSNTPRTQPYSPYMEPGLGSQSYQSTDPQSYPQYAGPGQYAPAYQHANHHHQQHRPQPAASGAFNEVAAAYRLPAPQEPYPQPAAPGPFSPMILAPIRAPDPEPRFMPAAQVGPGQYMPGGRALGAEPGPIQNEQLEDPFNIPAGGYADDDDDEDDDGDPRDPGFLRSNIEPHKKNCPSFVSDEEDHCDREMSDSPSLLRKERDHQEIYDRVEELDDQVYDLEEKLYAKEEELEALQVALERETARLKSRAVRAVGDAAVEVCGLRRGCPLWDVLVQKVEEKMGEPDAHEDDDEDDDGDI